MVEARGVAKAFEIPSVRRQTVREHALAMFRRRRFERLPVLREVSFDVAPGETVGVMGRNGCGKSTLLKIVAGIFRPDRGQVVCRGSVTSILELGVGWNFELDAIDNVYLLGGVMGLTRAEIRRSIDAILAFAELERFARLELKHYSSGMAARLAYAVAFQAVREVLVLDEIFAVGDAGFKARCIERFLHLRDSGHTVLLVSHDPRIIAGFCDRAILIDDGLVVADGPAGEVSERYLELLGGGERVES